MPYFSVVQLNPKTGDVMATVQGFHPDFVLETMQASVIDGREIATKEEYDIRVAMAAEAAAQKMGA